MARDEAEGENNELIGKRDHGDMEVKLCLIDVNSRGLTKEEEEDWM